MNEDIKTILILLMFFGFWLLRNNKHFGFLWKFTKLFFVILLATLTVNYAKGKVKDWWEK
jgi:hypothetical protein